MNSEKAKQLRYGNLSFAITENVLDFSFDEDISLTLVSCDKDAETVCVPDEIGGVPVTTVISYAFEGCTELRAVTLPASVHTVMTSAFRGCTALEEVHCAPSTCFALCAFSGCTALKEITPISCASEGLFEGCTALTALPLAEGVRTVESEAFANCTGLCAVTLPESVRVVEGLAFRGCASLKELRFPAPDAWVVRSAYQDGDFPLDLSDAAGNAQRLGRADFDDGVLGYYRTDGDGDE